MINLINNKRGINNMKKFAIIMLAAVCLLTSSACSNQNKENDNDKQDGEEEIIVETKADDVENADEEKADKEKTDEEIESKENIVEIKDGDVVTAKQDEDEIEITWKSAEFLQEVYGTSDNSFAQYFTDQVGETYLVAKIKVKNISGDRISEDIFADFDKKIQVCFNDKYNYTVHQIDPDSPVLSRYWSLEPLKTRDLYFLALVPDEVISMPYVISFIIGDTTYQYSNN